MKELNVVKVATDKQRNLSIDFEMKADLYEAILSNAVRQVQVSHRDIEEIIATKILNKLGYPHNVEIIRTPMNMCQSWYLNGNVIAWMKIPSISGYLGGFTRVEYWIDEEYL